MGGFLLIVYVPLIIDRGGGALVRQNHTSILDWNGEMEYGMDCGMDYGMDYRIKK